MKPDFALLLSFDGIALLRRASAYGEPGDGWYLLGTVSPNVPDLESALAELRARAVELAPGGDPEVKLVLPTEQVKFLDIDLPDSDISVAEAVEAALDGATPYSIDELVYDFHKDGAQVHIAAVARETLEEAESFATGNGFLPLGYVSDTSPDAGFTREPFFGPTQMALTTLTPGVTVQGDDAPIAILDGPPPSDDATAPRSEAADSDDEAEPPAADTKPDEGKPAPPVPEAKPETPPEASKAPEPSKAPEAESQSEEDPAPKADRAKPAAETGDQPSIDSEPVKEPAKASPKDAAAAKVDKPAKSEPVPAKKATSPVAKADEPEAPAKPVADKEETEDKPEPKTKPVESKSKPVEAEVKPAPPPAVPVEKAPVAKAPVEAPAAKTSDASEKASDEKDVVKSDPVKQETGKQDSVKKEPVKPATKDQPPAAVKPAAPVKPAPAKPAAKAPAKDPVKAPVEPPKPAPAAARAIPPAPKPLPAETPTVETPGFSSIRAQRDVPPPRPAKSLSAVPEPAAPAPRLDVAPSDEPRDVVAELAVKARDSLTNRPKIEPLPKAPGAIEAEPAANSDSDESGGGKAIGFASRRAAKKSPAAKAKGPVSNVRKPKFGKGKGAAAAMASGAVMDESDRMTVFGARGQQKVGGKPRFLGLILTAVLLLLLLAVAAVASIFLDDGLAGLFRKSADTPIATAAAPEIIQGEPIAPDGSETPALQVVEPVPETALALPETDAVSDPQDASAINVAALSEGVPAMSRDLVDDQIDGLSVPFEAEQLTPEQAEARYAATGIWQRAPIPPGVPTQAEVGDVYVASIDPGVLVGDAVAIPSAREAATDFAPPSQTAPYPPDAGLTFDENGLIEPTPEGVRHPAGFLLVLGPPPVQPPPRPGTEVPQPVALPDAPQPETAAEPAVEAEAPPAEPEASTAPVVVDPTLDGVRPRPRPEDLAEQNERANLGGISLDELRQKRPKVRPEQSEDKTEAEKDIEASALAVAASVTPKRRPSNISTIVRQAEQAEQAAATAPAASTASTAAAVAPRTVTPRIPSTTTVAAAATEKNAINLRRVNLIGVYGKPSSRRALIRLANGRYKKVQVGDRIDGGRVSAIGEGQLSYVKSGRSVVLRMPRG